MWFTHPPIAKCKHWRSVAAHAIGGLTEIGVSADERWLLVVSHDGRGLIDLESGACAARDDEAPAIDSPWINRTARLVQGIGAAQCDWFMTVGLWGGALASESLTAWRCRVRKGRRELGLLSSCEGRWLVAQSVTPIRAFGFSPSGAYLIFATSSDVALWRRAL